MAFTVSVDNKTVFGNQAVRQYTITADAATAAIDTGLDHIYAVDACVASGASSPFSIRKNALAAGTAAAGYIAITGVTSGDDLYVTVYGR